VTGVIRRSGVWYISGTLCLKLHLQFHMNDLLWFYLFPIANFGQSLYPSQEVIALVDK